MANPCTSLRPSCATPGGSKLTCLCSPTNHPGSFRCSRHRSPRGRPQSSSGRASQQAASTSGASATGRGEGIIRSSGVSAGGRTAKGRSVLRAHLLRLVSPPSCARTFCGWSALRPPAATTTAAAGISSPARQGWGASP